MSVVGGCFSELCSLQGFQTLECVCVGGGCAGAGRIISSRERHIGSVDCASSCPAHGRIELKMMSLIFGMSSLRLQLSAAEVCHPNCVLESLPSQISHGFKMNKRKKTKKKLFCSPGHNNTELVLANFVYFTSQTTILSIL